MKENVYKIGIIGLGYVGLPLAVEFAKKYKTIGFDLSHKRIVELSKFKDVNLEVDSNILKEVIQKKSFIITSNEDMLKTCNIYIITVPTPIDKYNRPNLTPIKSATETVSKYLKKEDIVIYESTVFPGLTEEICVPILERKAKMVYNKDFFVGYSPERINPGDKERTVTKIKKITSGSNIKTANTIDLLYNSIITAGTFKASSIKVAEAAKVIENAQRDINIAFVNELSKIFNLMKIDTNDVLAAASTKWNFLNFKPGLVGGHCIGVDPFYLSEKAQELGYFPEIILSGRRINDSMSKFIAGEVIKLMINKNLNIKKSSILIMGVTFKENCPDFRNTKVVDLINELKSYGSNITIYDPWVNKKNFQTEYNLDVLTKMPKNKFDVIVLAVAHTQFNKIENISKIRKVKSLIYDIKGVLKRDIVDARL